MRTSLLPQHFLRCFSSSAFSQLPRTPPRTLRQPVSVAHSSDQSSSDQSSSDQSSSDQSSSDQSKATEEAIAREDLKAPAKETETAREGELTTWKPPTHVGKSSAQSGSTSPEIFNHQPQGGGPHNCQSPQAQSSPVEFQLDAERPTKSRRKYPSAEELTVPLYRNAISLRWETPPPTADQLKTTERFFLHYTPKFLWSAAKFKTIDYGNVPEVAFLGRSNVGKSSLLNALLNNTTMARTSSKPGHTRLMNAFSICQDRLVLLDMPGYGHGSRPEWGVQIMKYLQSRKQFRRAFVLIDALHGPKSTDLMFLDHLGASGVPYQIVLSKIDRLKQGEIDSAFDNIKALLTDKRERRGTSALGEVLGTAADPAKKGKQKVGMPELRWAVMVAGGLDGSISLA